MSQSQDRKLTFKVNQDTWSNQRAKKRKLKRLATVGLAEEKSDTIHINLVFQFQLDLTDELLSIKLDIVSSGCTGSSQQMTKQPQTAKEYINQIMQFLKNKLANIFK